ncbi:MAG: prepilin-type N-terminal cleavage/methylation domain-containing protein [Patescibacteria group bacterium]
MKRKQKGFNLIEIIIYTAILSLVFTVVFNSVIMMMKSFNYARLKIRINNSAQASMERIVREIRLAYDIDNASEFNVNPGKLKLKTFDSLGAPATIEFYKDSGNLVVSENGSTAELLNSSGIQVTNLMFKTAYLVTSPSKSVKIEMELTGTQGGYTRAEKFYDTVILRGNY